MTRCRALFQLFALLLVLPTFTWAAPSVTNVRASQRTDGSGLVDVYYDVQGASNPMMVDVVFSNNNGVNWNVLPVPQLLSGDAGPGVTNGNNRHIVWDAGRDRAEVYWPQARAKVRACEIGQGVTFMLPGGVPPGNGQDTRRDLLHGFCHRQQR